MLVKKGLFKHKSYKETRVGGGFVVVFCLFVFVCLFVLFFCFLLLLLFFFFIIPNKFDVQFMSHLDTDNSVQVSFIPGCHRLMPVLANYPSLSCCRIFRDCQTKYTS